MQRKYLYLKIKIRRRRFKRYSSLSPKEYLFVPASIKAFYWEALLLRTNFLPHILFNFSRKVYLELNECVSLIFTVRRSLTLCKTHPNAYMSLNVVGVVLSPRPSNSGANHFKLPCSSNVVVVGSLGSGCIFEIPKSVR